MQRDVAACVEILIKVLCKIIPQFLVYSLNLRFEIKIWFAPNSDWLQKDCSYKKTVAIKSFCLFLLKCDSLV